MEKGGSTENERGGSRKRTQNSVPGFELGKGSTSQGTWTPLGAGKGEETMSSAACRKERGPADSRC